MSSHAATGFEHRIPGRIRTKEPSTGFVGPKHALARHVRHMSGHASAAHVGVWAWSVQLGLVAVASVETRAGPELQNSRSRSVAASTSPPETQDTTKTQETQHTKHTHDTEADLGFAGCVGPDDADSALLGGLRRGAFLAGAPADAVELRQHPMQLLALPVRPRHARPVLVRHVPQRAPARPHAIKARMLPAARRRAHRRGPRDTLLLVDDKAAFAHAAPAPVELHVLAKPLGAPLVGPEHAL
eukprot:1999942-Rhodomonas_salina.1